MAFLDNSGDIILDAVLTDTGRYRMAKGDGSFKITKFALGDDEINYASYNKNHVSGSAYYDLQILQTPVLEAFTNNTSTMKSKLISISRTNLLYMPVIVANTLRSNHYQSSSAGAAAPGVYAVAVDEATVGRVATGITGDKIGFLIAPPNNNPTQGVSDGILNGVNPGGTGGGNSIRVDQGLNTSNIPKSNVIDAELNETQYIIEIDNRLGSLMSAGATATPGKISFIDDDSIASYYVSSNDAAWVKNIEATDPNNSSILGPGGTYLEFKIMASTELQTSTYLFEKLGTTGPAPENYVGTACSIRYIDSTVKITGATTGYRIDLPVRYIKMLTP